MLRRLVEAHYFQNIERPTPARIRFWLRELRTPELLIDTSQRWPKLASLLKRKRPLLSHAIAQNAVELENALQTEEHIERAKDRKYWEPLKKELEKLRHDRL